jgi:hypothetical protein
MFHPTLLLSALLSVVSIQVADGYAFLDPTVTCQIQIIEGVSQRVCATYEGFGPSPADINGTIIYEGPTGYSFEFYKGLPNGTFSYNVTDSSKYLLDYTVGVQWENGTCQVKVNETQCTSCSVCVASTNGDLTGEKLTSDCTNIPHGRVVNCESAYIYFPLKQFKRYNGGSGKPSSSSHRHKGMMKHRMMKRAK